MQPATSVLVLAQEGVFRQVAQRGAALVSMDAAELGLALGVRRVAG